MSFSQEIVSIIHGLQDQQGFREEHWEGSFADYLQIVSENPKVARTTFQRVYDMIVSHGVAGYTENKKSYSKYHFFEDRLFGGMDAIYGLDISLVHMVNVFKGSGARITERNDAFCCCTDPSEAPRARWCAFSRRASKSTRGRQMVCCIHFGGSDWQRPCPGMLEAATRWPAR